MLANRAARRIVPLALAALATTASRRATPARSSTLAAVADTLRPGQCSPVAVLEPDSNATWVRVLRAWKREAPGSWSNESLRAELLGMARRDQAVRQGLTPASMLDTAFRRRMRATDSANTARLRQILARYGWPGKSLVGAQGAEAAFLLVQHSETLGPEGLRLMQAARPGEVSPADLALVIDRQRTSAGRPQLYGSQLAPAANGTLSFYPIEDPAHLGERRARAGLPPLRDYACMLATMYRASVALPAGAATGGVVR